MNTKRTTLIVAAAGVVAAGALAVPAMAGAGPFGPTPSPGSGSNGYGPGFGMGGMGEMAGGRMGSAVRQDRDGACPMALSAPQGTLTQEQKTTLQGMAEEEKLAGDLYQAFAGKYSATIFDRLAAAEDGHLTMVRRLLERYGLTDPTAGKPAGQFTTATVRAAYDRLLAQGMADQTAALNVGKQVEQAGISNLQQASTGLAAADVTQMYAHLLAASRQHLAAFTAWPAR